MTSSLLPMILTAGSSFALLASLRKGSKPITSMPTATATFATRIPIAPKPTTPRVLPVISGPTNWLLPFSTFLPISSPLPLRVFAHSMPSTTFLEASSRPVRTSSLTALALAPGVLKTQMPCSVHLSLGILLVPAPALAIASRLSPNSMSCMAAERTRIASGSCTSLPQV